MLESHTHVTLLWHSIVTLKHVDIVNLVPDFNRRANTTRYTRDVAYLRERPSTDTGYGLAIRHGSILPAHCGTCFRRASSQERLCFLSVWIEELNSYATKLVIKVCRDRYYNMYILYLLTVFFLDRVLFYSPIWNTTSRLIYFILFILQIGDWTSLNDSATGFIQCTTTVVF